MYYGGYPPPYQGYPPGPGPGGPMMHPGHHGGMMHPHPGMGPGPMVHRHPGSQPPPPHMQGGPMHPPPGPIQQQPQMQGGPMPPPAGAGGPGPGGRQWMEPPPPPPDCPPGLEYLSAVDRILVEQLMEPLEILTGIETCNRYRLLNAHGFQVYFAAEQSDYCSRQCCGSRREFIICIVDNMGREVMRVVRPFKCCGGCFCACCGPCQYRISVEAPVGIPIAFATEVCGVCNFNFEISDPSGTPFCYVDGPSCCACACMDQKFPVIDGSGNKIGEITKHFSGMFKEMVSDADNFSVSFPLVMPVPMKAALIGLLFLIDFIAFENNECCGGDDYW